MKKIIFLIMISCIMVASFSACDFLTSKDNPIDNIVPVDDSTDDNKDKDSVDDQKEEEGKYTLWLEGNYADDYNSDGLVDEKDYVLWQEFQAWRDTADALDYNIDRKITMVDYLFVKSYEEWRLSSSALDLTGDRKITIDDYVFYTDPTKISYITWLNSENVVDLNDDGKIDEDDYNSAADYIEFVGTFHIEDFTYEGDDLAFDTSNFAISDFARYVDELSFEVDKYGEFHCQIPEAMAAELQSDVSFVNQAKQNCIIRRISPLVATADISIPADSFYFTFYLTKDDYDYVTSFVCRSAEFSANVSFRIVYDRA